MKRAPVIARLIDRAGVPIGFCDVAWQVGSSGQVEQPPLPEVISLKADGRTFVRDPDREQAATHGFVACYVERSFAWAETFRLTEKH